jgi:hypothetical protein
MSDLAELSDIVSAPMGAAVRLAILTDLRESRLSRDQIAMDVSRDTGRAISRAMIDAFVAETKPHRFPAELIPAWTRVTGSRRLLDLLCSNLGLSIATEEDRDFAELGRTRLRDEKLTRRLMERIS